MNYKLYCLISENIKTKMAMMRAALKLRPLVQTVPSAAYHEKVRGCHPDLKGLLTFFSRDLPS